MNDDDTLKVLKNLIQVLEDGRKGFHEAAGGSDEPEVVRILQGFSDQRAELSAQLQTLGAAFGESAYDQQGSLAGALHRTWIDLRAAITSGETHTILVECERGEDRAVAAFRDALAQDIPSNVRIVVEHQASHVIAAHDKVKQLRDLAAAAHA